MAEEGFYLGIDVGTGSARAGIFDASGAMAGMGVEPIRDLAARGGLRRAVLRRHLAGLRRGGARGADRGRALAGRASAGSVRRDLLAGRARRRRPAGHGEPHRLRRAERDRVDGPPRHRAGGADHRDGPRRAPLRGRDDLAGDGDAEAALAEGEPAGELGARSALPRPAGLPRPPGDGRRTSARCAATVCKWTYLGHEDGTAASVGRWDAGLLPRVGLEDLAEEGFARIGTHSTPDRASGPARSLAEAAAELGLRPGDPRSPSRSSTPTRAGSGSWARRWTDAAAGRRQPEGAARAHRRHVELPHGGVARAALHRRHLGPLLRRRWSPACGSPKGASRPPARLSTT